MLQTWYAGGSCGGTPVPTFSIRQLISFWNSTLQIPAIINNVQADLNELCDEYNDGRDWDNISEDSVAGDDSSSDEEDRHGD